MSLDPLFAAGPTVVFHTGAALAAFLIGVLQLAGPKGTRAHRAFGWAWVLLLAGVAASSFWIHELQVVGPFSPIHLLSILTLIALPYAVIRARQHEVKAHKRTMLGLFFGALVIAGVFTLLPGRVLHAVLFGPG